MSFVETYLSHYGVKGMKWGVRRRSTGFLGRRSSSKPEPSEDKKKAEAARAKLGKRGNSDTLSNEELRLLINRMNQEQSLQRLLAAQGPTTARGWVTQKLKTTGVDEFTNFAQGKQTKYLGTVLALKGIHSKAQGKHIKKK